MWTPSATANLAVSSTMLSSCRHQVSTGRDRDYPSCDEAVAVKHAVRTSNNETSTSLATCRQTLHCQRTLELTTVRLKAYMEKFRISCDIERDRQHKFDSSLRILQKQVQLEMRDVMMQYLALWRKFETKNTEFDDYSARSEAKTSVYKRKINDLEKALQEMKIYREQEQTGVNLMQTYWEQEKEALKEQWEAESAIRQHEAICSIMKEVGEREKYQMEKLQEQKESEIKSMEAMIVARNKSHMELLAGNIAFSCKTKMERQMLASYDVMEQRHRVELEEHRSQVSKLQHQLEMLQQQVERKTQQLDEKEKHDLSVETHKNERENELRSQLAAERQQNASLRRQLEFLHCKQIEKDLSSTNFSNGLM